MNIVPTHATAELHGRTVEFLRNIAIIDDEISDAIQLLEQYRLALLDIQICAYAKGLAKPKWPNGTPLEEIAWIVVHRGIGQPIGDDE